MSTYISLGTNTDGTPNTNPTGDELDAAPAPGTDVAVDMVGRNIRLAIDPGGCTTYMQPTEARRLATYLEYAATECERRRVGECMIMRRDVWTTLLSHDRTRP